MLERNVKFQDTIYSSHKILSIEYDYISQLAYFNVESVSDDGNHTLHTYHQFSPEEFPDIESLYSVLSAHPDFDEYMDPKYALLNEISGALTDEQAIAFPSAFPQWTTGVSYILGQRVRYNGVLYKCLQEHLSQTGWSPEDAPSLWARMLIDPEDDDIPEWIQPDSTNPYMTGDKVIFEGKTYESLIDNNVWSPSEYPAGWREI